jgi:hypothetical protein
MTIMYTSDRGERVSWTQLEIAIAKGRLILDGESPTPPERVVYGDLDGESVIYVRAARPRVVYGDLDGEPVRDEEEDL